MKLSLKNAVRTIAYTGGIALFAGAGLASANTDTSSFNRITGPFSDNTTTVQADSSVVTSLLNTIRRTNTHNLVARTGGNLISNNTESGGLFGGSVDFNVGSGAGVGSIGGLGLLHTQLPSVMGNDVQVFGGNQLTGPNSLNQNNITSNHTSALTVRNITDISNQLTLDATTGGNAVTNNTEAGSVSTGDVRLSADMNSGLGIGGGLGGLVTLPDTNSDVSANFENNTTGPNSVNRNNITANSDIRTTIQNTETVDNTARITADTGGNNVSTNTIVGTVRTGSVDVSLGE